MSRKQFTSRTYKSAKLLRVAQVTQRAMEIFKDRVVALHWLNSENPALGNVTPLSLLDTELGAEAVRDALGRIEHGVFG